MGASATPGGGGVSPSKSLTNYASYIPEGSRRPRIGHLDLDSNTVTPLSYISGTPIRSLYEVIAVGEDAIIQAGEPFPRSKARLLPPIYGRDILAVGKNYAAHAKEFNASGYDSSDKVDMPTHPVIFTKRWTSAIADGDEIYPHPGFTESVDYEGEIGVIVGKAGFKIDAKDALEHVWGFTIINDVTARERQRDHKQFYLGKSPDTFAPMGPIAVPKEHLPKVLTVQTVVNGEKRQEATTDDLIFSIPTLIETLSAAQTLQPGDVLATGTPAGVGFGFDPKVWLHPGDEVKISVTGLGTLTNKIASPESRNSILNHIVSPAVPVVNDRTAEGRGLSSVGSKQLFYQRKGGDDAGRPIYFIHGLGGTSEYFGPLMTRLGNSWTYHLADLEGHGLSPTSATSKLSIASFASDAYQLCSRAGITSESGLTVVAHSMGCLVAMKLALDHPDLVKTLILQGPGPSPLPEAASKATYARAALAREKGMLGVVDAVVGAGTSDYSKAHNPLAIAAARVSLLGQDAEGYAKACTALADSHADTLDISALKVRVLIITGEEDKVSPPEMCKRMKEQMPNCEDVVVLPQVAHWHLFEATESVCSAVADFLGTSSDEVLQRVRRVENLLERQVYLLEQRLEPSPKSNSSNQDTLSQHQSSSVNSSPWTEIEATPSETAPATNVGTILVSEGGYERFIPGLASSDAESVNELIQSASAPPMSSSFPFSAEALATRRALLDTLPPGRQCDELKDIFFEVFSPTVQALVLLIYALSHAHGPSWALLGATFNICVSIGCHIDPSQLNLDPVRSEQRRRCWAGLMLLYTIQNTCLGNIAPMKVIANVRLPADVDDDHITMYDNPLLHTDETQPKPLSKMSYILFKFKLYRLASDITNFTRENGQLSGLFELDAKISREEHEHDARFADPQRLPVYHLAHLYIIKNYTNHLRLILHRPYLPPHSSAADSTLYEYPEQMLQSRQYCKMSAMKIIDNHEDLCCNDRLKPYRWFVYGLGGYQTFLAASTLVVLLGSEDDSVASDRADVIYALRKCQARFEQLSPRSDISAKAARILRRTLGPVTSTNGGGGGLPQETQRLYHQSSSISDESKVVYSMSHRHQMSSASPGSIHDHHHQQQQQHTSIPPGPAGYSQTGFTSGGFPSGANEAVTTKMEPPPPPPPPPPTSQHQHHLQYQHELQHQHQHHHQQQQQPPPHPHSFFPCPQPLYELMSLPAEQWLGGPSALAWDWSSWVDVPEASIAGSDMFMDTSASGVMM
ncbi:hypothetical protein AYO20_00521 [Fonsecaea nubica]|uniref:Transcription factor domain-containing protein n=1 Tax=Fonsecaea nubica TaxID=856822 RepID=A0A178DFW0_9EURO|nr:hypothetical protein AYO20_00521 [Fonsecaea nubica]OAL40103.1 hypothetical protein AYO20_00521 [Fonsecaea nubica]